jgi:hypothetical protein
MSYQTKIKRYTLIIEQLNSSKYPSKIKLIDSLSEHGLKLSERQLKSVIAMNMRTSTRPFSKSQAILGKRKGNWFLNS